MLGISPHSSLNLTRSQMGSQWGSRKTGVIWSRRRMPVISRAVAFCTDYDLRSKVPGRPQISELQ